MTVGEWQLENEGKNMNITIIKYIGLHGLNRFCCFMYLGVIS